VSASALEVERVDFITIPTRDTERARAFYHETLGLPLDDRDSDGNTFILHRRYKPYAED
jgi:catechol 2,3-dioxygenase-like lactoylglutathione lyase family enzyme